MAAARFAALPPGQGVCAGRGGVCRSEKVRHRASALAELAEAGASVQQDVSWQIYAGAAAGVAPFVVAGVEFGKRIAQQRRCKVCAGSGLVKRGEYLFRCSGCGGFLPWQSWNRFFSGR